jgi:isopentenyldiphosphate isomerase
MPPSDPRELLTHVSEDDTQILGPVERGRVHGDPSLVHRAAHVLVLHPTDGTLLLQKRSLQKDTCPGQWDTSVGGHVGFGQSYLEAALRESEEELGITLTEADLEFLYVTRLRETRESENTASYFCVHGGPFQPDADEIETIRFWSRHEIDAALGTGILTPNFEAEYQAFLASDHGSRLR